MASIRVEIDGLGDLFRRLGVQAEVAVSKGLLSAANRSQQLLVKESNRKRVKNSGEYARRWKAERVIEPGFGTETRRGVQIWNEVPYSGVIEEGRRPGARMPPLEPIARWAQRKFRIPYARARGLSFVIARKIAREGIPGRFVLRDAMPRLSTYLRDEVMHELALALRSAR